MNTQVEEHPYDSVSAIIKSRVHHNLEDFNKEAVLTVVCHYFQHVLGLPGKEELLFSVVIAESAAPDE